MKTLSEMKDYITYYQGTRTECCKALGISLSAYKKLQQIDRDDLVGAKTINEAYAAGDTFPKRLAKMSRLEDTSAYKAKLGVRNYGIKVQMECLRIAYYSDKKLFAKLVEIGLSEKNVLFTAKSSEGLSFEEWEAEVEKGIRV